MTVPTYVRHEPINLKTHAVFNEAWLHDRIKEDTSILGLGDLRLLDHERKHAGAGRLDLLLDDVDENRRYEVEVMLGATDPSHIVRTIEYWDIERRRYPGYEHIAVLIAEDITSRFLNVLSLMSGSIPFIAIQLSALQVGENIVLNFVRVLDQTGLRIDDTVEVSGGVQVDRNYWEQQVGIPMMALCDDILKMVNSKTQTPCEFNFLEQYFGLRRNGVVDNFIWFEPKRKKAIVHVGFRTGSAADLYDKFEQAGLPTRIDGKRIVKVTLTADTLAAHKPMIEQAIEATAKESNA